MAGAKGQSRAFYICPCGKGQKGELAHHSHLSKHCRELGLEAWDYPRLDDLHKAVRDAIRRQEVSNE